MMNSVRLGVFNHLDWSRTGSSNDAICSGGAADIDCKGQGKLKEGGE